MKQCLMEGEEVCHMELGKGLGEAGGGDGFRVRALVSWPGSFGLSILCVAHL